MNFSILNLSIRYAKSLLENGLFLQDCVENAIPVIICDTKPISDFVTRGRTGYMLPALTQICSKGKAKKNNNASKFQLWQPESDPIQLINIKMAHQKLDYIHNNPIEAGFVTKPEEWKYSSAIDYFGGKGLLEIMRLDTLVV